MDASLNEPIRLQLALDPDREDEAIRIERWRVFVQVLRRGIGEHRAGLAGVLMNIALNYPDPEPPGMACDFAEAAWEFAQIEGWPSVFSALSLALLESEADADPHGAAR